MSKHTARHASCDSYGARATTGRVARVALRLVGGPVGAVLAALAIVAGLAVHTAATPDPVTLTAAHAPTPTATPDVDADTSPIGAGMAAVGYVADDVWTLTWDASWMTAATIEGWTPWAPVNGHGPCAALVGDTTAIACADGYVTTS